MRKIIAIVGESGAGKDTLANIIEKRFHIPQLVSYTTRKKREGEMNEHKFIDIHEFDAIKQKEDFFAYTVYGGNHYFTTVNQIMAHPIQTYIIDESGILFLKEKIKEPEFKDIKLVFIKIVTSKSTRKQRGVCETRMKRDFDRISFDDYDLVISNNGSLFDLENKIINGLMSLEKTKNIKKCTR